MLDLDKIYFKDILMSLTRNILLVVIILFGLINQVNLIISTGIKSANLHLKISKMCLYLVPYLISMVLPFSSLIGITLLISKYRKEKKIIALQNLGIGPKEIKKPLYIAGIIVVTINYWLYFFISPNLYEKFKYTQFEIRNQSISNLIEPKTLKHYSKGVTIYIEEKKDNLQGIFIADTRDKNSIKSFVAESGIITSQGIELFNGTYYETSDKQSVFLEFKRYLFILSQSVSYPIDDPYAMSLSALFKAYDINSSLKIQAVINQKIVWPLYSLIFIFLCFNLEWYFSYVSYSRSSNKTWISLTICIIIAVTHFLIQNLGTKSQIGGSIAIYLFPIIIYLSTKKLIHSKFH